ncbi:hypothetical protein E8E11_010759 [Didymella keratinophila]|nr:hypothetical protein E8E11_010759 [Didymella keratinophila]
MDPTVEVTPIPAAVDGCARGFLSLAASLRQPTRFSEQVAAEAIVDEFDRFNYGEQRSPLNASPLLVAGQMLMVEALAIVEGKRIPWDEETYSDSESDSDDGNGLDLQGDTELNQLYASFKSAITSLMRLSMAVQEPAPNRRVRRIDKSHFEQHDMLHVQAKFPSAPQYLAQRLGRAISSRRQYLTYREQHHDKLSKGIDRLGLEAVRSEFTTNSTEATQLQRTVTLDVMDDGDDTASMTSYATSVNATLKAPSLPKEAHEKEHYSCPLCFALIAIHTTTFWKRHVYQDLRPYCCTYEDCTTADRLFDSRHAWFAHEIEAHYTDFQCVRAA